MRVRVVRGARFVKGLAEPHARSFAEHEWEAEGDFDIKVDELESVRELRVEMTSLSQDNKQLVNYFAVITTREDVRERGRGEG